jgi:hypothetical protein
MERTIEPRPVQWRMLIIGSTVWAPFGDHGWRAATVVGLGKNRGERTVVRLTLETGGQGTRYAERLFWRRAECKGRDKPPKPAQRVETAAEV